MLSDPLLPPHHREASIAAIKRGGRGALIDALRPNRIIFNCLFFSPFTSFYLTRRSARNTRVQQRKIETKGNSESVTTALPLHEPRPKASVAHLQLRAKRANPDEARARAPEEVRLIGTIIGGLRGALNANKALSLPTSPPLLSLSFV